MRNFKNYLNKIDFKNLTFSEKVLLFAPFLIWFSYFPNFQIARESGTNFEFSLSMIFIVILALSGIFEIWKNRRDIFKKPAVALTGIFIFWNFLSVFWAENPIRAFLVSGVWFVLWLDFLAILSMKNLKKIAPFLCDFFIFSSVFMAILSIIQVIYGAWFDFLLCAGCVARGFGFVRPSVFAIEPQFFGNMLIVPILIIFQRFISKRNKKFDIYFLSIMLVSMWLTLSRGAIFALIFALIFLVISAKKERRRFAIIFIFSNVFVCFAAGILLHGIFTQFNPRISDDFYSAVSKSVNQMSLGKISLPKIQKKEVKSEKSSEVNAPKKAIFDGYVERSTDERTNLSNLAIQTWKQNLWTIFCGVGSSSAGKAIFDYTKKTTSAFEIVQNEFLSILLELGVIGFLLWLAILFGVFRKTSSKKWLWAVFSGYIFQWNFFSGLPNVLHIYLILAIIFAIIEKAYEKK